MKYLFWTLVLLPTSLWSQTVKTVGNITDLINALQSNTTIEITDGFYYVAKVGDMKNKNVALMQDYENQSYITVSNISNVVLRGIGNRQPNIVSGALSEPVIKFENCTNITIENVFLAHGPAKGYCDGAALGLNNCTNITVRNCTLFGSGSYGIMSASWWGDAGVQGLTVENTMIRGCSSGIVFLENSGNLNFSKCNFNDNAGWGGFGFRNCTNVKITDSEISYNNFVGTYDQSEQALWDVQTTSVEVVNCVIQSNSADYEFIDKKGVVQRDCKNINNSYVKGQYKQ